MASDLYRDPQTLMLAPETMWEAARQLAGERNPYRQTQRMARLSLDVMKKAVSQGQLKLNDPREDRYQNDENQKSLEFEIAGKNPGKQGLLNHRRLFRSHSQSF